MSEYVPTTGEVETGFSEFASWLESNWPGEYADAPEFAEALEASRAFDRWHAAEIRRAKTVTAEQIEAATLEFALQTKVPYERMPSHHRHYWRQITIAAFRSAGFLIEGDDDE